MNIVFDTNVLLAGMFTHGLCEALLDECLGAPDHMLFTSQHILDEFSEHAGKFRAPAADVREALVLLQANMKLVTPTPVPADACRDADDLPVLGTLLASQADCLVTGDKDLLVLRRFESIPIYSPRAFYDLLHPRETP